MNDTSAPKRGEPISVAQFFHWCEDNGVKFSIESNYDPDHVRYDDEGEAVHPANWECFTAIKTVDERGHPRNALSTSIAGNFTAACQKAYEKARGVLEQREAIEGKKPSPKDSAPDAPK